MNMLAHAHTKSTVAGKKQTNKPSNTQSPTFTPASGNRPQETRTYDAPQGETALLGIYTSIASTFPESGHSTDKTPSLTVEQTTRLGRAKMWRLKSVVNGLLAGQRTSMCMKYLNAQTVDIKKSAETNKCSFTGLVVCGSVWTCPNCSRRISEKRRDELAEVVAVARSQGETVLMVTQTFSHLQGDVLVETLQKLSKAQRYFTSGRAATTLREQLELDGTIRALEVTHGRNGWHPHLHTLWFIKSKSPNRLRLKRQLFCLWWKACKKVGLTTSYKHGLDISCQSRDISTYIAKWGIETEMTKSNFKTGGKKDSVTPWGMLQHIADKGPKTILYTAKFVEYAAAFKGQRQLWWSKGLRARLALPAEFNDLDIVKEDMMLKPSDIILASLTLDQWYPITRYNLESSLLDTAETNPAGIMQFVLDAKHRYLQDKSDKECDRKKQPRVVVPAPDADTKLFAPRPQHNGQRLIDQADKELDFTV